MYDEDMSDDFTESQSSSNEQQDNRQSYGGYRNPSWQNNSNSSGFNKGNYQGGNNGSGNFNRNNYNRNGGGFNKGNYQKRPFNGNNQPKEFNGIAKVYKSYAVASNENVPSQVVEEFKKILDELDKSGFVLRISSMKNTIDEQVGQTIENKEVILPWRGFNNIENGDTYTSPESKAIAKLFQPSFDSLTSGIQLIITKNVRLVLGNNNRSPVNFVLCWSEDGCESTTTKTS